MSFSHTHSKFSLVLSIALVSLFAVPVVAKANSVSLYGGVSNIALLNTTPEIAAIANIAITDSVNVKISIRHAASNDDINGGDANIFSTRLYHYFSLNAAHTFKIGPYIGNQYLSYGKLYNNAIGGGIGLEWQTPYGFTLAAHSGSLYGLDGTIGKNLTCAGNLYEFGGKITTNIGGNLSLFLLGGFERYIGTGNALTSINGGSGISYTF